MILISLLQVKVCRPSAGFVHSSFLPHCLNVFILLGRLLRNSLCSPVAQWCCWGHSFYDEGVHAQFCSPISLDGQKVMFLSSEKLIETKIDMNIFFYTGFLHVGAAKDCGFNLTVLKLLKPSGKKGFFCSCYGSRWQKGIPSPSKKPV